MRKSLLVLLAVVVGAYVAYKWAYPTYSWHQKLTVAVETPDGLVTGSGVTSVTAVKGPQILPEIKGTIRLVGEAVVVDLGQQRYPFALLGGMEGLALRTRLAMDKAQNPEDKRTYDERRNAIFALFSSTFRGPSQPAMVLDPRRYPKMAEYPLLVTFTDINDPKTVQRVDPDNLAATFGAGYRLKSITLKITGEPITKGRVEKLLGWLGPHPEPKLGPATGRSTNIPFYRRVSHGDFIRFNR